MVPDAASVPEGARRSEAPSGGRNPRLVAFVALSVGFGILVRAVQYAHNRSLWADEALLALGLTRTPLIDLAQGLPFNQVAPLGFLVTSKTLVGLFGSGEPVLRSLPFASSVAALLLFYPALRELVGRTAAAVGTLLFSVSGPAIYYAVEYKHYSTEVLVTLVWLWALGWAWNRRFSGKATLLVPVTGMLAILFSFSSALVVAGTGGVLLWLAYREEDPPVVRKVSLGLAPAALTLAVVYLTTIVGVVDREYMSGYWSDFFLPFPPLSVAGVEAWLDMPWRVMRDSFGLPRAGLGLFGLGAGVVALSRRNGSALALLAAPLVMAVGFAAAGLYPLGDRLALYLIPVAFGLIGAGVQHLWSWSRPVGLLLLALVTLDPSLSAAERVVRPTEREEVRDVLEEIEEEADPGMSLYVHWSARPAYEYYRSRLSLEDLRIIPGPYPGIESLAVPRETSDPLADLEEDLQVLRPESWFLFLSGWDDGVISPELLKERGRAVDSIAARGVRAYRVVFP